MSKKSEYLLGFTSLPDGKHLFSFEIGKTFFEQLDYSEIKDAKLKVRLSLEKQPNMMIADFEIAGKVKVMCDVCTDEFDLPIKGTRSLVYKFADEDLDDENVSTIYPHETEINVSQPIYEFTTLLLPVRRIHPKGKCNQDMLNDIDRYLMIEKKSKGKKVDEPEKDTKDVDPRWAALKKLKK